jgi:hypothetical protein
MRLSSSSSKLGSRQPERQNGKVADSSNLRLAAQQQQQQVQQVEQQQVQQQTQQQKVQPPPQQQVRLRDSFARIDMHTSCLAWHLMQQLLALQHSNGQPAAVVYCEPAVQELLLQQRLQFDAIQAFSSSSSSSGLGDAQHAFHAAAAAAAFHAAAAAAAPADAGMLAAFRRLQGPVVTFNLLRPDGSWVGHREVAKLALIHGICIRTGKMSIS